MTDPTDTDSDRAESTHNHNQPDQAHADGDADAGVPPDFEADWGLEDTLQDEGVQIVEVQGMGKATAELVNFGTIYDAQDDPTGARRGSRGGGDDEATITPDLLAEVISEHYVSPSFEQLTGQKIRQMKPSKPGALLDAITDDDVDVEMSADGTANVSVDDREDEKGKSSA